MSTTESQADAVLYDEEVAREVADSFLYLRRPEGWKPKDRSILNRFERFMSRSWR